MFSELHIRGFKAWRDSYPIRLAPLTVFFGTNSSGKTSICQFLLMLKQTAQSPDRRRVLHPGDANTPVELGTFHDMVFRHDPNAAVSFSFKCRLPSVLKMKDTKAESGKVVQGRDLGFEAEIGRQEGKGERIVVKHMAYTLGDPDAGGLMVEMKPRDKDYRKYDVVSRGYDLIRNPGRPWPVPSPIRFYGFPNEVAAFYQNAGFTSDLVLGLEEQFTHLYYLGPLRDYPRRSYTWSGEIPEHVGYRGERAVEALLAAGDRRISPGRGKRYLQFTEMIARWLEKMNLITSFEARPVAKHRKEHEVLVRTAGSGEEVNLADVGFGLSQLLPVLVQAFYTPQNSTIIFEQPEIHLHPSVQAALADLFIEAVHAREDGEDRNIQVIVESHSEHFLSRLQRRVAEEVLQPNEAALYFCKPGPNGSTIESLNLDIFGNITNWPHNFFGDAIEDAAAMTDAAMQRQSAGAR